jgi:hypothetical protein
MNGRLGHVPFHGHNSVSRRSIVPFRHHVGAIPGAGTPPSRPLRCRTGRNRGGGAPAPETAAMDRVSAQERDVPIAAAIGKGSLTGR